jgi:hypothetical protein
MAGFDFKTAPPEAAISDSNLLFGAASYADEFPTVYPVSTLRTLLLGGGTLAITTGKTVTVTETLSLTASAAGQTFTFPSSSGTVATLNAANLFTTANTFSPVSDVPALTARRFTLGATSNILQLQDESNNVLAAFDSNGLLTLGRGSGQTGAVKFANSTNNNLVTLQPGVSTNSVTYTLPLDAPAVNGYALTSTTSGVLSWANYDLIAIGTTSISGGTSGRFLYDNVGVIGESSNFTYDGTNVSLGSSSYLSWSTDLKLFRDAAGVLAQRDGVNSQEIRVYNTYADGSNYERLSAGFVQAAGTFSVLSQAAGTGTVRPIDLQVTGGASATFGTNGSITFYKQGVGNRWQIDANGNFVAGVDNTFTIGAPGASRPSTVYVGTAISIAGASLGSNALAVTGSGAISTTLTIGGAAIGTNALAVTGTTALSSTLTVGGDIVPAAGVTAMTDGFTYVPASSGAPTGIPTGQTGRVPLYYDTNGDCLYVYNGGWKKVSFADNFLTQE